MLRSRFAVVAALAYGGFNQLSQQRDIVERSANRTRAVQSAVQRMSEDFEMLERHLVRLGARF